MGADAAGLLYTLLVVGHERKQFDAHVGDLLPLLDMSRARFDQAVAQFALAGVIAVKNQGDDAMQWTILRAPQGWSAA